MHTAALKYHAQLLAHVAARNMSEKRPEEYYISDKWDKCTDLAIRRIVYGTLGGGAAALILFRTFVALHSVCL